MWGEARGEGAPGMRAVAWVILNRHKQPKKYGKTIAGVCLKDYAFSCWNADRNDSNREQMADLSEDDVHFLQAKGIWDSIVPALSQDITQGATHYKTKAVNPMWAKDKMPCVVIGNHQFYNNID